MARLVRSSAVRLAAVIAWLGLTTGCVSNAKVDNTARDASIYQSVIADVVDQSDGDVETSEDLPVLFIEAFDADGIPLEVQVEVVAGLVERYEVRFIDDRDEAIEVDLDGEPVRAGSFLIGLGPIVLDRAANVRSELYLSNDEVRAYRYTLTVGQDDIWEVVVGSPEQVEPEGFVSVS